MSNKTKAITNVTSEVIKNWKEQYDKVLKYETKDGRVAYFKEPDISTLDASAALAQTNPVKSNVVIAKDCFIGGDESVINDKKCLLGLMDKLKSLIVKVEGEFSEL
jgi:hypothetical protein